MYPVSCANTHHYVTYLVNQWMVKNTKTWISQERNITFPWNKKILNLCLRWHILRCYQFTAEVTFKELEPLKVNYHPTTVGGHRHSVSGGIFSLSHDLSKPHDQTVMWLYGWEFLIISHHLGKFDGHRHCGSRDKMF